MPRRLGSTAAAAPAQGRPPASQPLTPPPPLSGPESRADPGGAAVGGDAAGHHSSPRVGTTSGLTFTVPLEWASPRLPPLWPQPKPPRRLFSSASEPAAAGNARGRARPSRDRGSRRGGGAARGGSSAAPRELAPARPRLVSPRPIREARAARLLGSLGTCSFAAWVFLTALCFAVLVIRCRRILKDCKSTRERDWGRGSKTRVGPAGGAAQKPSLRTQENLLGT